MRLSEAIRLGAMLKPQTFDVFSDATGTCALGAAIDACGVGRYGASTLNDLSQLHGWNVWRINEQPCPHDGCAVNHLGDGGVNIIPHLNDEHRWTREQIADWIESIERGTDAVQAVTREKVAV